MKPLLLKTAYQNRRSKIVSFDLIDDLLQNNETRKKFKNEPPDGKIVNKATQMFFEYFA